MRVFKYFFSIILFLIIFINLFSIEKYDYSKKENIEVEVKGEVINEGLYTLNSNSTFEDLLKQIKLNENADISNISLSEHLYNKQIINIGSNKISKISINTATIEELCSLKGIGDKTAQAIIEYRDLHHGFKYIEEIMNVKGIGVKKFENIKEQISL